MVFKSEVWSSICCFQRKLYKPCQGSQLICSKFYNSQEDHAAFVIHPMAWCIMVKVHSNHVDFQKSLYHQPKQWSYNPL